MSAEHHDYSEHDVQRAVIIAAACYIPFSL